MYVYFNIFLDFFVDAMYQYWSNVPYSILLCVILYIIIFRAYIVIIGAFSIVTAQIYQREALLMLTLALKVRSKS